MKGTNFGNTRRFDFDVMIGEIAALQVNIDSLVTTFRLPPIESKSVTQKVKEIAEQLLTAAGKVIDAGRDLNAITSCMLDVSETESESHEFNHVSHITAWAGWTGDLMSDVLDACDDLISAIRDLTGQEEKGAHGDGQIR